MFEIVLCETFHVKTPHLLGKCDFVVFAGEVLQFSVGNFVAWSCFNGVAVCLLQLWVGKSCAVLCFSG